MTSPRSTGTMLLFWICMLPSTVCPLPQVFCSCSLTSSPLIQTAVSAIPIKGTSSAPRNRYSPAALLENTRLTARMTNSPPQILLRFFMMQHPVYTCCSGIDTFVSRFSKISSACSPAIFAFGLMMIRWLQTSLKTASTSSGTA